MNEVDSVRAFTYLGVIVSTSGGCEPAVTLRAGCGCLMFSECGRLLHRNRFPLWLKETVYKSYLWPDILYRSEAWNLKESEMNFVKDTDIHGENNVSHIDKK